MEGCKQFNVLETEQWIATHSAHGVPAKQLAEHQPPKGAYVIWISICPCGSRHVTTEEADAKA